MSLSSLCWVAKCLEGFAYAARATATSVGEIKAPTVHSNGKGHAFTAPFE